MREISGFKVNPTAIQVEADNYRPGLAIFNSEGAEVTLLEVGYSESAEMTESYAHDAAQAVLNDVIRVSDDGKAVFIADGAIRVRLVWARA